MQPIERNDFEINETEDRILENRGATPLENPLDFIKAGKSIFTVENSGTGNRFTYKVSRLKGREGEESKEVWFVGVLTGPDNYADYRYLGTIFGDKFRKTRNSKISEDAKSFTVFDWIFKRLNDGTLPSEVKFYHEGRCGRCGRRLTVPESIRTGYGPECASRI